jgi:glycosyltransferase involved in cell wall biosynthesis
MAPTGSSLRRRTIHDRVDVTQAAVVWLFICFADRERSPASEINRPVTAPRVSIIVPCHNGGRFLDGLLASLGAQTFRDFETIIVDNGSTEVATREKLKALDPAVRVVAQENRYLPGARNRGFLEARAELVLPLDCDDTLEPSYLAETVPILENAPADVAAVFTHMRLTGTLAGELPRHLNRFDQLFLNQLPYCMLIRRSAWQAVGGYDETMRDGTEDWEFNIRLWRSGFRGIELAKPLFVYSVSPDGMLMSRATRMHGTIWRHIRTKHADLYRMAALVRLWRETRTMPSKISAGAAAGLLISARFLPESWFNNLFFRLLIKTRARRIDRGELQAGGNAANGPAVDGGPGASS